MYLSVISGWSRNKLNRDGWQPWVRGEPDNFHVMSVHLLSTVSHPVCDIIETIRQFLVKRDGVVRGTETVNLSVISVVVRLKFVTLNQQQKISK